MHNLIISTDASNRRFRLLARLVLTLCTALWLVACSEELSDEEYVMRAEAALKSGDLKTTAIELKNALRSNPLNARARLLLGETYYTLGDGASSEKELRRAREMGIGEREVFIPLARAVLLAGEHERLLEEFPDDPGLPDEERATLLALHGLSHLYLADLMSARSAFDAALAINPEEVDALLGQAYVDKGLGDYAAAREWLVKAMAQNDKRAEGWSLLGELEEMAGERESALEAFGKAIKHSPRPDKYRLQRALLNIDMRNYAAAHEDIRWLPAQLPGKHYARGLIELQQEDLLKAQTSFEQALSKYEDYPPAQYYLGLTHILLGNDEQALSYLRQFLAQVPESVAAANLLAKLQIRKGDLAAAEALLDPIFQKNPEDAETLDMMAGLELIQGNNEQALETYRRLLAQNPESANARSKLGLALIVGGNIEQGTAEMQKAIELAPEDERLELKLVLAQLNSKELEGAVTAAERWAKRKPESRLARLTLGWAYLNASHPKMARDTFEEVLEMVPGEPSASHNLAVFALYSGDLEAAKAYYEQSQMFFQGHPGTSVALARVYLQMGERDNAVKVLQISQEKFPLKIEPGVFLARLRLESGASAQALADIKALEKIEPQHPGVLAVLGAAEAANGNYSQAVAAFERLKNTGTLSARDHYLLAQAYFHTDNDAGFANALNEAYATYPDDYNIQISMAGLLMGQGKLSEAAKLVEKLQQTYPDRVAVQTEAARLARLNRAPAQEVEAMQRARELAPEDASVTVRYALALVREERIDEAISVMEEWMSTHPDDALVRYNLANLYLLAEDEDKARETFTAILKTQPRNVLALNNLAWLLRDQDLDRALAHARKASELAPDTPSFQDTLAMLLLMQPGEEEEAVRLLRNATEKNPDRPDFQLHLAQALAQKGDQRQAHRVLSTLLREHPEFEQRDEAQAMLERLSP
tara:strand:- start:15448 stop:18258 length:2811 start_codon:yes stop_codon:yes gene_type:complete